MRFKLIFNATARLFQNTLAVKFGHRIVYLGSVTLV